MANRAKRKKADKDGKKNKTRPPVKQGEIKMETEPTKEQLEEFWQWGGFERIDYTDTSGKVCSTHWAHPLAIGGGSGSLPVSDLNNLWKYVVPKLVNVLGNYKAYLTLKRCLNRAITGDKKFEDEIFWAVWEVIKDD